MIRKQIVGSLLATLMMVPLSGVVTADTDSDTQSWDYELSLYAWAKSVKGTSGDADIDLDFWDDIVDMLEGAFMTSFNARWGLFSGFATFEYNKIGDDARLNRTIDYTIPGTGVTVPIEARSKIEFEEEQYNAEIGLGYDVYSTQRTMWDLIAGLKWYKNDTSIELRDIKFQGPGGGDLPSIKGRKIRESDDWWHPFLGMRFSAQLSDHWRLRGRGDYGRRDSDNESWTLEAMFDYRLTDWGALEFGYRYREIDYDNDSSSHPYSYDVTEKGPIIGFIFHF